jgi:hypothetical protein
LRGHLRAESPQVAGIAYCCRYSRCDVSLGSRWGLAGCSLQYRGRAAPNELKRQEKDLYRNDPNQDAPNPGIDPIVVEGKQTDFGGSVASTKLPPQISTPRACSMGPLLRGTHAKFSPFSRVILFLKLGDQHRLGDLAGSERFLVDEYAVVQVERCAEIVAVHVLRSQTGSLQFFAPLAPIVAACVLPVHQ